MDRSSHGRAARGIRVVPEDAPGPALGVDFRVRPGSYRLPARRAPRHHGAMTPPPAGATGA
ncbi:hypothetical protein CLM84_28515, partial [Streptomyces albidoflavus]